MAVQASHVFDEEPLRLFYGFHVAMTLLILYVIVALFYEVHKRVQRKEDIECYNRNLLMANMLMMLIAFPFIMFSIVFGHVGEALDGEGKSVLELSISDFSDSALYCFLFAVQGISCHQTINVMRIWYEKAYSNRTWYHRHFFGVFLVHLVVYISVFCMSRGNLAAIMLTMCFIDFPQHFWLLGLLVYRLCVAPNEGLNQRWRLRNMWGAAAVFLHILSVFPLMVMAGFGPSVLRESASMFWLYVEYVPMYGMAYSFIFCWYKVIIYTPSAFVSSDEEETAKHIQEANVVETSTTSVP